ncbi:MAG: hypothetical protein ACYST3_02160 [Planctomycetota bacterium]
MPVVSKKAMKENNKNSPETYNWQRKLLPYLIGLLTFLTLFFLVASIFQLYRLQDQIANKPKLDLEVALKVLPVQSGNQDTEGNLQYVRWKTLALLEKHALEIRYHQIGALHMSRIWARYLGFLTGMILSLMGAAFILGKLKEAPTKASGESISGKFSITTSSPGIILAFLGTALMITTIVVHHEIEGEDNAIYTDSWFSPKVILSKQKTIGKPEEWNSVPKTSEKDSGAQEDDTFFEMIEGIEDKLKQKQSTTKQQQ